jgi:hypothetical protein
MRLAIMQPYFFPYLGYFQLIAAVDKFILYDNLNYIKKGWMHRNRILHKGQAPLWINVPVAGRSSFAKIRDVVVAQPGKWAAVLRKQLYLNYCKAAYYPEVTALLDQALPALAPRLVDVNVAVIRAVAAYLGLATDLSADSIRYDAFEAEVAQHGEGVLAHYQPDFAAPDVKTLRSLFICRQEGATAFINAIGGRALYDKAVFARHGVALSFVQTTFRPYPQNCADFVPGLSIIDVLMHCGRDGTRQLLNDYTLV